MLPIEDDLCSVDEVKKVLRALVRFLEGQCIIYRVFMIASQLSFVMFVNRIFFVCLNFVLL